MLRAAIKESHLATPLKSRPSLCRRLSRAKTTMPLFWKAYKSDVTSFIEELKAKKPTLEDEQRQGRALLWDKPVDRATQAEYRDATVAQQPYVYQTKH